MEAGKKEKENIYKSHIKRKRKSIKKKQTRDNNRTWKEMEVNAGRREEKESKRLQNCTRKEKTTNKRERAER